MFRSAHPSGGTNMWGRRRIGTLRFNPCVLAGANEILYRTDEATISFNPRARRDANRSHARPCFVELVSIHTPATARTRSVWAIAVWCQVSIHAPMGARTSKARTLTASASSFNPRTPCGCEFVLKHFDSIFLKIHAREQLQRGLMGQYASFQSTHRYGRELLGFRKLMQS